MAGNPIWMALDHDQRRTAMDLRSAFASTLDSPTCDHDDDPHTCIACLLDCAGVVLNGTPDLIRRVMTNRLNIIYNKSQGE